MPTTFFKKNKKKVIDKFKTKSNIMSHEAGGNHDVKLCRYDLSNGMARSMSMLLIGEQLEGIWHTSIVAFGKEFYFDGGVGIVTEPVPGSTRFGTPLRSESLGTTSKSLEAFLSWVAGQTKSKFGPNDYDLMANNCNHFTDAASLFLLGKNIPEDIRQMLPKIMQTPLGKMIAPILQQTT